MVTAGVKRVRATLRTPPSFPGWPQFEPGEIEAAANVLRSGKTNYWTGNEGRQFEHEFARYVGTRFAVAVSNGTAALELALRAIGIGPGDEVIVTPRSFIASASAVVLLGATPVFADVEVHSGNITAATIEPVLTPRTKAILVVHLGGWPCEMDSIADLARAHGIQIVEDCAQAHGSRFRDRSVGGIGTVAAWSFCNDKVLTTGGEGGMVTTSDEGVWRRVWSFKDHGKSWDAVYNREHAPGFRWLHESFGSNLRMLEMQAAIGRVALLKLEGWVEKRRSNAAILQARIDQVPGLIFPEPPPHVRHCYYKCHFRIDRDALRSGWSRDRVMSEVNARGAPCLSGSCSEIYLEKAFVNAGLGPRGPLPGARELSESSLMFPVHPTLGPEQMEFMGDTLADVMTQAVR